MNVFQRHLHSYRITIFLLGIFLHAHFTQCCLSGRYGRYDNWPTNNDWDELLLLVTGKYGNQGWGWSDQNSYAYNSFGDYPYGSSGGYGSSLSSLLGSGSSSAGLSTKPTIGSSSNSAAYNRQKMKEALNSYFNSNKKKPISSHYNGPSHHDSSFNDPHYQFDSPPPTPSFSSGFPGSSWGDGSSSSPGQSNSWPSLAAHTKSVGVGQFGSHNNQFQSDFETLGGYGEKIGRPNDDDLDVHRRKPLARNPARRRLRMRPGRFNPNRRWNRRRQRMLESDQISRTKLNTRFGGYKVDHSKLRA